MQPRRNLHGKHTPYSFWSSSSRDRSMLVEYDVFRTMRSALQKEAGVAEYWSVALCCCALIPAMLPTAPALRMLRSPSRLWFPGVGGIIIVTMVTGFMVVYNSSSGGRSPSSASRSLHSHHEDARSTKRKQSVQVSTLEGVAGIMDLKPLKMHCRTCAVVTSSGHLTGSNRGEEIDHSDCVIRMNDAPCAGHHPDVGRRTSLRIVAHSSLQRVLRGRQELLNGSQDTVFIFWGPSSCMRRDGRGHVYNKLRLLKHLLPKLKVYTISRSKMLKFDELFKKETGIDRKSSNSWLSTGWFTMAMALELCDRINVFGMVPPDFCRSSLRPTVPYHYYEPLGPDECAMYLLHERSRKGSHHRFITEKTVFSKWAQTLNIHFYQPDWTPTPAVTHANCSGAPSPVGS